jgi:hypothetical protein
MSTERMNTWRFSLSGEFASVQLAVLLVLGRRIRNGANGFNVA